jgi:Dehydrogenases with different specificities (related to short-chain alcohol dehydrogenases)
MMNITLHNKTAIVTGAATGIGRAIAILLGQAGARVIINHLNRAREADQVVQAIALRADRLSPSKPT